MVETPLTPDLTQPDSGNSLVVIVGIPAYNEEKTIAKVVLNAQAHAHVVVVCDDGEPEERPFGHEIAVVDNLAGNGAAFA